jgi:hypothetical protein
VSHQHSCQSPNRGPWRTRPTPLSPSALGASRTEPPGRITRGRSTATLVPADDRGLVPCISLVHTSFDVLHSAAAQVLDAQVRTIADNRLDPILGRHGIFDQFGNHGLCYQVSEVQAQDESRCTKRSRSTSRGRPWPQKLPCNNLDQPTPVCCPLPYWCGRSTSSVGRRSRPPGETT